MTVDKLARGIEADPSRVAEAQRYYEALVGAMNGTHDPRGEQDALCAFEAVATLLGQMVGGFPPGQRDGLLTYVRERALAHADPFFFAGKAARYVVEARA